MEMSRGYFAWVDKRVSAFDDVPMSVISFQQWPLWRRMVVWPDEQTSARVEKWRHLMGSLAFGKPVKTAFPGIKRPGIFMSSLVMWDHFVLRDSRWRNDGKFNGWSYRGDGVERVVLLNPNGAPTCSSVVDDFCCDITDIGGIFNSKSRDRYFDSVNSFGRDFAEFKCTAVTENGLSEMLNHSEVRVTKKQHSDGFFLPMWDARLFLSNGGGSHHLAGAAYIAQALNKRVPVFGKLRIEWLNDDWWQWVLMRYRIAFVPSGSMLNIHDLAWLTGACYENSLPWGVCEGSLLLLPGESPFADVLLDGLAGHGIQEITTLMHSILEAQLQNLQVLKQRWPNELAGVDLKE
jgi:hypothetical protein